MSAADGEFIPRRSWEKVDLSKYPTISLPARFGHAMATVSGSRVLIYGGIGCAVTDNKNASSSGFCIETVLLNDLWEFDLLKWSGSGSPLSLLSLSPVMRGLAGPSLVALPGEDHRLLSFGGASVMYPLMEVLRLPFTQSEDKFEYRQLQFRSSKAESATVSGIAAISSSSVSSNESHVMLVAGYLGNSRTAAVHTYDLKASSPDLALQR